MLQQASKLLFLRTGLQNAAASCYWSLQQLQNSTTIHQQLPQQFRTKSTAAGPTPDVTSSQQLFTPLASSTGHGVADPAAAAAAAAADPQTLDILSQADALIGVSQVAGEAAVAAALGSVWKPTRLFMELMLWTHDGIGLPWFEAIAAMNLIVRLGAVPITIMTQRLGPVMQTMRKDTEVLAKLSRQAAMAKDAQEYTLRLAEFRQAKADFDARYKGKKKASFLMPIAGVAQGLLFISQFNAISTLANAKVPSMTYEGALWFTNLTIPDPYFGLPVICAAATLASLHSSRFKDVMMAAGPQAEFMKKMMTGVAFLFIPMGMFANSSLALLWAFNAVFGIAQNYLLATPAVRSALGLPPVPVGGQSSSEVPQWMKRFMPAEGSKEGSRTPAAAAAATTAGAPAPGTKPSFAVNYVRNRPRRKAR